ncbi:unnamed protein product [Amoebophrya sp. A25]|nr:unnamed protein product [Amoebophrya sp. A25]|eukprot:GSA25T00024877001.1
MSSPSDQPAPCSLARIARAKSQTWEGEGVPGDSSGKKVDGSAGDATCGSGESKNDISFDRWMFFKTALYESLPPYINLLAIIPIERFVEKRTIKQTLAFCRSRLYIFVIPSALCGSRAPPAFPFLVQLLAIAGPNYMLPIALYLWLSDAPGVRAVLDLAEILTWWVAIAMRNCVVAIKYGYLEKSDSVRRELQQSVYSAATTLYGWVGNAE